VLIVVHSQIFYCTDGLRPHVYGNMSVQKIMPFQRLRETSKFNYARFYGTSSRLSHLDDHGKASMVDVGDKHITKRTAIASGRIFVPPKAYELVTLPYPVERSAIQDEMAKAKARRKGDVLTIAQLAGIMAAKQTSSLIPLCHPLAVSKIDVSLTPELAQSLSRSDSTVSSRHSIVCTATVTCEGKTGVEMEALTAVSISLLTIWDMLKAVAGQEMEIGEIMVTHKAGGRSGDFSRNIQ
jgi:GTP 3',8-cyclase